MSQPAREDSTRPVREPVPFRPRSTPRSRRTYRPLDPGKSNVLPFPIERRYPSTRTHVASILVGVFVFALLINVLIVLIFSGII